MLSLMRNRFGRWVLILVVVLIGFVFVFYGVFTPGPTVGGGVAGTVNGDRISLSEFNRAVEQRMQFFKGLNLKREQLKQFGIYDAVFRDLVNRRLMIQEATRLKIAPGPDEIRDAIRKMPVFQNQGNFDKARYLEVLKANRYTPSSFEKLVTEDLITQKWRSYFKKFVRVSEGEVQKEFMLSQDQRKLKYVMLTPEVGQKGMQISSAEIKTFLSQPEKMNLVKSRYDLGKNSEYKDKKIDQVEGQIARELIASEKREQSKKIVQDLAEKIRKMISLSKKSDQEINRLLKSYDLKVHETEWISRKAQSLPVIGDAEEVKKDLFLDPSPLDLKKAGKAKIYSLPKGTLVTILVDSKSPNYKELEKEEVRARLLEQITMRKEQFLSNYYLEEASKKAKIQKNDSISEG